MNDDDDYHKNDCGNNFEDNSNEFDDDVDDAS